VCQRLTSFSIICVEISAGRLRLKCDGTRAETRFRLSAIRTSPLKSAGASVQSTTGSRGLRISGSNVGYTMFRVSVKSTGYPFHSPVSPSLPFLCVTVCHHISTGLYNKLCVWYMTSRKMSCNSNQLKCLNICICISDRNMWVNGNKHLLA